MLPAPSEAKTKKLEWEQCYLQSTVFARSFLDDTAAAVSPKPDAAAAKIANSFATSVEGQALAAEIRGSSSTLTDYQGPRPATGWFKQRCVRDVVRR